MLVGSFTKLLEVGRISEVIVQLSLVVAMFDTDSFYSPPFHDRMKVKDHRGDAELATELQMCHNIHEFIATESSRIQINSLEEVDDQVRDATNLKAKWITCHHDIIVRAKALMQRQCCAYLKSVLVSNDDANTMMGTVRCSVIYGRSMNNCTDEPLVPWKEGGIDVMVRLPHDRERIKNPLYAPKIAKYLLKEWMNKFPFWCRGVIDLIENAKDMELADSNQFSEGVFRTAKHVEEAADHVYEPSQYVIHRWDKTQEDNKHFIQQSETVGSRIEELESRREKKRQRKAAPASASAPLTQDQITQLDEDAEDEVWCRRGSSNECEAKLRNELRDVFNNNGITNSKKQHEFVSTCLKDKNVNLMGYCRFNDFMKGQIKTKKGLKKCYENALRAFLETQQLDKVKTDSSIVESV